MSWYGGWVSIVYRTMRSDRRRALNFCHVATCKFLWLLWSIDCNISKKSSFRLSLSSLPPMKHSRNDHVSFSLNICSDESSKYVELNDLTRYHSMVVSSSVCYGLLYVMACTPSARFRRIILPCCSIMKGILHSVKPNRCLVLHSMFHVVLGVQYRAVKFVLFVLK